MNKTISSAATRIKAAREEAALAASQEALRKMGVWRPQTAVTPASLDRAMEFLISLSANPNYVEAARTHATVLVKHILSLEVNAVPQE